MLLEAGVDGVEVRLPGLDDRDLLALARQVRASFPRPATLLVNRRFDIALAADADGVHLPAAGLSTAPVRESVVAERLLVGRSTHDLEEVEAAALAGADYVVFGPVFPTPSKAGRLAARGLSSLGRACRLGVPVIAIGGLDGDNAREALAAGAHGVAAIRAFATAAAATALVGAVERETGE
jgi:thiamine-phosphate pyrophosphorylase